MIVLADEVSVVVDRIGGRLGWVVEDKQSRRAFAEAGPIGRVAQGERRLLRAFDVRVLGQQNDNGFGGLTWGKAQGTDSRVEVTLGKGYPVHRATQRDRLRFIQHDITVIAGGVVNGPRR
ncbi:MAG TPA: hypothetical protein VMS31_00925 [Pyrinomonadaceae bacterium]|nr:hypothetical protein [Pyrinomonadaceae bacterium]